MVNITLHVQHWDAGGFGNFVDVLITKIPIALPDRDTIKVAPKDLANFLGSITVRDLGGFRINESAMPAQLGYASFERTSRAGAGEKEKHRQGFISQQC